MFLHVDEQLLLQEFPQLSAQSPLQLFEHPEQDEDCELPSHVVEQVVKQDPSQELEHSLQKESPPNGSSSSGLHDVKIEGIDAQTKKGIVLLIPLLKKSLLDKTSFLIFFITSVILWTTLYLSFTALTEQPIYLCSYHPPICPLNIP